MDTLSVRLTVTLIPHREKYIVHLLIHLLRITEAIYLSHGDSPHSF